MKHWQHNKRRRYSVGSQLAYIFIYYETPLYIRIWTVSMTQDDEEKMEYVNNNSTFCCSSRNVDNNLNNHIVIVSWRKAQRPIESYERNSWGLWHIIYIRSCWNKDSPERKSLTVLTQLNFNSSSWTLNSSHCLSYPLWFSSFSLLFGWGVE